MARAIRPYAEKLDKRLAALLRKRGHNAAQIRALQAITPAAASRLRTLPQFLEQVEYSGRRLAKMNVSPAQVADALRESSELLGPALGGRFQPAREQLHLAATLTLNEAYYRVREAEAQALFGMYRAEVAAADLDDLLHRFVRVLTPAFHAESGCIQLTAHPRKGTQRTTLDLEQGAGDEESAHDARMRNRHA